MDLNFRKLETKCGAAMWLMPLPQTNTLSFGVLVKAGTRDENWPKESGIAHALEHMHFQGTEEFSSSRELSEYIEEIGGGVNAWTWKEMTFHHARVPAIYARRAFHVISQQLRKSVFPEEKISIEMKNVIQEIRRRNDNPQRLVWMMSDSFMYNGHPLSKDTLGDEKSVEAFRRDDFVNFKSRYYDPANYTFIVAGNIKEEEAVKLVDEYFPELAKLSSNIRQDENVAERTEKKLVQTKDVEQVHTVLSALTGKAGSSDSASLDFFADMISGGMSFPLFQDVRDKLGLCYEIWADQTKGGDNGKFSIYIGTDPKRSKEAIQASLDVIKKYKADKDLLEKVKKLKTGRLTLQYENTGNIINMAAEDIAFIGRPKGYNQVITEIEKIKIEDINKAVESCLNEDKIFTTILAPDGFE